MPVSKLEEQARNFFEKIINQKNTAYMDVLAAPDFVDHEDLGPVSPDREGAKAFMSMALAAFPDMHATIEDMISNGDRVVIRSTWTGTHQGEFMGIPATGKKVSYEVIDILKFSGTLMSEHWGLSDNMKMMTQLGEAWRGIIPFYT
jgi:steroid delta-isomerase-like uncharacterized protein